MNPTTAVLVYANGLAITMFTYLSIEHAGGAGAARRRTVTRPGWAEPMHADGAWRVIWAQHSERG